MNTFNVLLRVLVRFDQMRWRWFLRRLWTNAVELRMPRPIRFGAGAWLPLQHNDGDLGLALQGDLGLALHGLHLLQEIWRR